MAIRRRRPAAKPAAAPTTRVLAVDTQEQFSRLLAKAESAGRLLVVQFYQARNYTCMQMRQAFKQMSGMPGMRKAVFAEVELDTAEDELLEECRVHHASARIPLYRFYVAGQEVQSYVGGRPAEVQAMIREQLAELPSGRGLLSKLFMAAGVAAAAAAAAYWHLGRQGGSGGGPTRDLGAEMRTVVERMKAAQQRLKNAERAGRLKSASNQKRIIKQLEAQQQRLEQQIRDRQQPAEGRSGGSSSRKKGSSSSSKGGKQRGSKAGPGAAGQHSDGEFEEGGRRQRRRGGLPPIEPDFWGGEVDDVDGGYSSAGSSKRPQRGARRAPAGGVVYSDEE